MSIKRFVCNRNELNILGRLALPDGNKSYPLVIFSHGFGYNEKMLDLEKFAENGIAACDFDFCGGSPFSQSDGSSTEMSVLTEAADLEAVIDTLKANPRIDGKHISLIGFSQGGYVSSIVAMKRPQEIKSLFLLSPAFLIADFPMYSLLYGFRKTFHFGNMVLSRKYIKDIKAFSVFEHMDEYTNPVVIYHGTSDSMAPISYSERAARKFPQAKLTRIPNAGHSLTGHIDFIQKEIIKAVRNAVH